MCNLVFLHLRDLSTHDDKCTARACSSNCRNRQFFAWLDAPLLPADHREDARFRAKSAALLRGEI